MRQELRSRSGRSVPLLVRLVTAMALISVIVPWTDAQAVADPIVQSAVPLEPLERAERGTMTSLPVRLTVSGRSIGIVALDQPAAQVVSFFEELLGPPSDVIVVESPVLVGCFGGAALATYSWPGVVLSFSGAPDGDRNVDRWVNFRIDERGVSDKLLGVQSTRGATFADSLDRWLGLHPEASPYEGQPGLIGPTLAFTDGLVAEVGRDTSGRYVVQSLNALSPVFCE